MVFWMLGLTQIYHNPVNTGRWHAPDGQQITDQLGRHVMNTFNVPACLRAFSQTSHQPVKERRSRPRPRLSRFHSRWCSPLLSFYWRRSWLLCLWTGNLSRRWTPICKRYREHPIMPCQHLMALLMQQTPQARACIMAMMEFYTTACQHCPSKGM